MTDKEFLEKCRNIDFSAGCDMEKNLEILKARLSLDKEENVDMMKNKRFKRPVAVAAVIAAVLSVSVVAAAAVPMVWRYLDTRVVEGEAFVFDFTVKESEYYGYTMTGISIDRDALEAAGGGAIIVEVEGETRVMLDELHFESTEEAFKLLEIDNPLLPSYLPEGFALERVTFPVSPINHPDQEGSATVVNIRYTDGEDVILLMIAAWDESWGISIFAGDQRDITINGHSAGIADGGLKMLIDNVSYFISAPSLTQEQLIRIAESLQ